MFTGIIEATAEVLERSASGLKLKRPGSFDDLKLGSSVCVSGVCLTVTNLTKNEMSFDVIPETFAKSKLGSLKEGDRVNLERALSASGRFDGHIVQGHVEGVGRAVSFERSALSGEVILGVSVPSALLPFIVPKGSITLDGVSLTVASLLGNICSVALIPTTLRETSLGNLREGESVNVETDILGRYTLSRMSGRGSRSRKSSASSSRTAKPRRSGAK